MVRLLCFHLWLKSAILFLLIVSQQYIIVSRPIIMSSSSVPSGFFQNNILNLTLNFPLLLNKYFYLFATAAKNKFKDYT